MIKTYFLNLITKHLFKLVSENDILVERKGQFYFKGQALTNDQKKSLINAAKDLKDNVFFRMVIEEMYFVINRKMQTDVVTMEGLRTTKAMLFTVDLIQKKVDNISKREH